MTAFWVIGWVIWSANRRSFGIWTMVDFVMIAVGSFTDKEGLLIKASN